MLKYAHFLISYAITVYVLANVVSLSYTITIHVYALANVVSLSYTITMHVYVLANVVSLSFIKWNVHFNHSFICYRGGSTSCC